jgi:hypothetical protein
MQIPGALSYNNTYQSPASTQVSNQRGPQADVFRAKNITQNPVAAAPKKTAIADESNKDFKGYSPSKGNEVASRNDGSKGQIINYKV